MTARQIGIGFWAAFLALCVGGQAILLGSDDLGRKVRYRSWLPWVLAALVLPATALTVGVTKMLFVLPVAPLLAWRYRRSIRFCQRCRKTFWNPPMRQLPTRCPACGARLEPPGGR